VTTVSADNLLTTVAGTGLEGYSGDNQPATSATLDQPTGVARDAAGNLYIADTSNNVIRKVAPDGTITTVAGDGSPGYSGDTGSPLDAELQNPVDVAVDSHGNLYIADFGNNVIRKVSDGIITTVAGTGDFGYGGDNGPATSATLDGPEGLTVDAAGNLFIADTFNNAVREVSAIDQHIRTVAGDGTGDFGYSGDGGLATKALLDTPEGVAVDNTGSLYIADTGNNVIRLVSDGNISTYAGNGTQGYSGDLGTATQAQLNSPNDVAVDVNGNLYIADTFNDVIRKVSPQGFISTVVGNGSVAFTGDHGPATAGTLDSPEGLTVDAAGNLLIADTFNDAVREVSPAAEQLAIHIAPPPSVLAGNPFAVIVAVVDANGFTVSGYNGPVKVSLGTSSYPGDLNPTTVTAVNGLATFNLSLTQASTDSLPYNLSFSADGVVGVSSANFAVLPQAASAVFFVQGPINTAVGQPIHPTVTVDAEDTYGNPVTDFSGDVTIQVASGPAGASLGGTLTEEASGGVASFPDLTLNQIGTYTLTAASGTLTTATSKSFSVTAAAAAVTITTAAGNGPNRHSGDGGLATSALLHNPSGVAFDHAGNLYIADTANNAVRKVTPNGIISTVAGNGTYGYHGDGGRATAAELASPSSVTVDDAGNLYIADTGNNVVRKVSPVGIITNVAGVAGHFGYNGDNKRATLAWLNAPTGLALDAVGNLYIADTSNNRIREVSPAGVITTFAGAGIAGYSGDSDPAISAELNRPSAVAWDSNGNLYIADTANNVVRVVFFDHTLNGYFIDTLAGNGTQGFGGDGESATAAELNNPSGLAVDNEGLLYIADTGNNVVRQVYFDATLNDNAITTIAGDRIQGFGGDGGLATDAALNNLSGLAVDAHDNLYIADTDNNRIRKMPINDAPTITTFAGTVPLGDGGAAGLAELNGPSAVAQDSHGNLYIADTNDNLIRRVSPGGTITTFAGNGDRGYAGDGGAATAAALNQPAGVFVDSHDNLFIADTGNNVIREVSPDGTIRTAAGNRMAGYNGDGSLAINAELNGPKGVAADAGNLYIADTNNGVIREVTTDGKIETVAGNGTLGYNSDNIPATEAELNDPTAVAVDAAHNLFIADSQNDRIRKVSAADQIITTVAGAGVLDGNDFFVDPQGVALDAAGNLYIADTNDGLILKVSQGTIATLAGGGTTTDDGEQARFARLASPAGLMVDPQGNVYVADAADDRVRKVIDPARKLAFTTEPTFDADNSHFTVAVTVEDAAGIPVSGFSGAVTLTLNLAPDASPDTQLTGTLTQSIDLDNGVATFTGLYIDHSGDGFTITANAPGLATATSDPIFLKLGATATQLAFTSLPPAITAGVKFTVVVEAQDSSGVTDPTYPDAVTLTLPDGTNQVVNAQAGVATFKDLIISQPVKNVILSAAANGLTGIATAPFDVGAAVATQLVLSQPADVRAGVPFAVTVTARDGSGNLATGFNGSVSVNLGPNATGAGLDGITMVSAVNGIARFSLSINKPGTGYTLTASASGLPSATTTAFDAAATPELLAITPPAAVTAGTPLSVTVTARDANNHTDLSFNGSVTLAAGPGSPADTFLGTTPGGTTTVTAVNGTATFTGLLLGKAGSYTLTATTANLIGGFSIPFTVNAGAAAQLAFTPPATATAGSPFPVTVTVEDSQGNPVPSFAGSVNVMLTNNPSGATLTGTTSVPPANGIATFNLTLDKAGSGYTLTASAAGLPAVTSLRFLVGGITATQLGIVPPAFAVADVPFTVTVAARDSNGNLVPSFNDFITLDLGLTSPANVSLGGTLTVKASHGIATFSDLTLATAGTGYTLAASAGTLNGASAQPFAVLAGGNDVSTHPVISAQGNYVAYVSAASNLVPGLAATGFTNIFLYRVADDTNALVSGTIFSQANGSSDSPVIDLDGSYVAYRSDATNLVTLQGGAAGNVFVYALGGGTTLVSAVSGLPHTGAGSSYGPAIDGDGTKIVYLSKANDLVPNQVAVNTVNVYIFALSLGKSFLVTGAFGSAATPGNGDATNALISRHSYPLLSSVATNLVPGVGAHSNGYLNKLIVTSLHLVAPTLQSGTGPNTLVGTFAVTVTFVGQYVPPLYSLVLGYGDDSLFQVPGGGSNLLTGAQTVVDGTAHPFYVLQVSTDVGLGPIVGLDYLRIPVSGTSTNTNTNTITNTNTNKPRPITALLFTRKVGKKKRLMVQVLYADTRAVEGTYVCPFQGPPYTNIQVSVRDTNGDGVPDQAVVTAHKGKKKLTIPL
jgi:sugar lactone lactonase YvrE